MAYRLPVKRHITVLRHSIAMLLLPGMDHFQDMTRNLTEEGKILALRRRLSLGAPKFDFAFYSPALRTLETAMEICYPPTGEGTQYLLIKELGYEGPETERGRIFADLCKKLGHNSLLEYGRSDEGDIFREMCDLAWSKVRTLVWENDSRRTLVVGHSPIIAGMCYLAASNYADFDRDAFAKEAPFDECQGFSISFLEGSIDDITIHRDVIR